jgi:hypothetical protein
MQTSEYLLKPLSFTGTSRAIPCGFGGPDAIERGGKAVMHRFNPRRRRHKQQVGPCEPRDLHRSWRLAAAPAPAPTAPSPVATAITTPTPPCVVRGVGRTVTPRRIGEPLGRRGVGIPRTITIAAIAPRGCGPRDRGREHCRRGHKRADKNEFSHLNTPARDEHRGECQPDAI